MPLDMAGASAPPKRAAKTSAATTRATSIKGRKYEEGLNALGGTAVFGLTMGGQLADAAALSMHGPGLFHEVALLAEGNEKVASVLAYMTEAGPYAGIITAALPLALQIMANHGRIDASKMPPELVVNPAILEAQARAEMAQRRREIEAQQTQAEQELAQAEKERQFYSENTNHGPYEPSSAYGSAE